MALRGTLKDFSLGEILQLIGFQRKTGVLTVEGPEDAVTITFQEGSVVGADSRKRRFENRVGNLLVRAGKLTAAQLQSVLAQQPQSGKRIGEFLVSRQLANESDIRQALRTQTLNIIYRVFRWKDGRYDFTAQASVAFESGFVTPVATENILMEAARMSDEWPMIEERIPSLDIVFARAAGTERLAVVAEEQGWVPEGAVGVSPTAASVWKLVDGRRTLSEIAESTFYSDFDVVKAADELLGHHLVIESRRPVFPERESAEPSISIPPPRVLDAGSPLAWFVAVALLALSVAAMRRNPLNPVLRGSRPGGSLASLGHSLDIAMLMRVERGIDVFYLTEGRYPASLAELASSGAVPGYDLTERRYASYRYILRPADGKYDLYGRTAAGRLDPNLSVSRSLDPLPASPVPPQARPRQPATQGQSIEVIN